MPPCCLSLFHNALRLYKKRNMAGEQNSRVSVKDLHDIITAPSGGLFMMPSDPYNEVFAGIFIGEESTARDESRLQQLGITHILNAAYGLQKKFYFVNTGPDYYKSDIVFHGVPGVDMQRFQLSKYFEEAADFIAQAVGTKEQGKKNGKVFVHCKEGISRSATLVLAYMIRDHQMGVKEALETVRSKREIVPNEGFLLQLIEYSCSLGRD